MSTTEPIRNKTDLQKFMDYYAAIQPNPRNQALILLGLYTALRIGDILTNIIFLTIFMSMNKKHRS